jgi:iron complex outermembrane receptor protein
MPDPATTVWAAVSRAVRTPVRLDADLVSRFNGVLYFEGNDALKPETVLAGELGLRHRFGERLAVDIATFTNGYDNIRTYESKTSTYLALPWTFKNGMNARGTGVEVTVLYQPLARLFLKGSYRYLDLHLTKDAGSGDFLNALYEANDPRQVAALTARVDVAPHWAIDATVRGTSRLPQPRMPAYVTADLHLGWSPNSAWELALIGRNLFDPQHPEFVTPNSLNQEVARSVTVKATWRY